MKQYVLSPKALTKIVGSIKGSQPKYLENGYWYKVNQVGYEGLSEYLTSKVLSHSNITNYVEYEECTIDGKAGCRSKDFLKPGEVLFSFSKLHELYLGTNLVDIVAEKRTVQDRIDYVKDFLRQYLSFDCSEYLAKVLSLDLLILNPDRHFNNLCVIINEETGEVREAPIFDNGRAFLSEVAHYNLPNIEENIEKAKSEGKPFTANFEMQAVAVGISLSIDYDALYNDLDKEPNSRAKQVLLYQLECYRDLFCEKEKQHDDCIK